MANSSANESCQLNNTLQELGIPNSVPISIYGLFVVIGLIGNFMLVFILVYRRKLRFPSDIYFLNAAIADIFCVCMLPAWIQYVVESVTLNRFACITFSFGFYISLFLQSWMLILITAERYSSLVWIAPNKKTTAIKRCVWAWFMSIFLASPYSIFRKSDEVEECLLGNFTWHIGELYHAALDLLITTLTLIIPLAVLLIYSFRISRSFWGNRKLNNKTSLFLMQIFAVALGFWGPFHLFVFIENVTHHLYGIQQICRVRYTRHLVSLLTESLVFLRSVFNPVVYLIISAKFRRRVQHLFQRIPYTNLEMETDKVAETMELKAKGMDVSDPTPHDYECFL
uniref:Chemokine receptor vGPCR2 n=2 Tax=Simian cytomegalovirus (strain Colburn) TaxID=50292 RepID=D2E2Z8_SCMVC|nr:chemokine receptor-like protein [Simian cytomegalovirus]ACQ55252.1 chemokine receptor vGPCR2 [Cercopithecine betaherpesvirus 5]